MKQIICIFFIGFIGCNDSSGKSVECEEQLFSSEDNYLQDGADIWQHFQYDPAEIVDQLYGTWTGKYNGEAGEGSFRYELSILPVSSDKYIRVWTPECYSSGSCSGEQWDSCVEFGTSVWTSYSFQVLESNSTSVPSQLAVNGEQFLLIHGSMVETDFNLEVGEPSGIPIEIVEIENDNLYFDIAIVSSSEVYARLHQDENATSWKQVEEVVFTPIAK